MSVYNNPYQRDLARIQALFAQRSTNPVIEQTRQANRLVNFGVGGRPDPIKTANIDARRRAMNVNQLGMSDFQRRRYEEAAARRNSPEMSTRDMRPGSVSLQPEGVVVATEAGPLNLGLASSESNPLRSLEGPPNYIDRLAETGAYDQEQLDAIAMMAPQLLLLEGEPEAQERADTPKKKKKKDSRMGPPARPVDASLMGPASPLPVATTPLASINELGQVIQVPASEGRAPVAIVPLPPTGGSVPRSAFQDEYDMPLDYDFLRLGV